MPTTEARHPFLDKEPAKIQRMFNGIAPRYDLLNHLLSFNLDRSWREQAIDELRVGPGECYLDACSGTGDLAYSLATRQVADPGVRIFGSDFSLAMLTAAKGKGRSTVAPRFLAGDTLNLPFADDTFDGVMIGFGLRNLERLETGLLEFRRILKPGGRLIILEFTVSANRWLRPFVNVYVKRIMPFIGNVVSRSRDRAYSYLNQSVDRWPDGESLAARLREVGFKGVRWRALFPGNVAIHRGYC